jgi:hypothetical protein
MNQIQEAVSALRPYLEMTNGAAGEIFLFIQYVCKHFY